MRKCFFRQHSFRKQIFIALCGQVVAHLPQRMHSAERALATGFMSIGQTDSHAPQRVQVA